MYAFAIQRQNYNRLLEFCHGGTSIISLLDRLERGKDENPSIGIILCAEKDNVEVELALEGISKPIGVADYKLIVPQKELKQLISDEIKTFSLELAAKSL